MDASSGANGYVLNPNYMEAETPTWMVEGLDEYYNQNDKEKAREILAESSYNGEPVRILVASLTSLIEPAYALKKELDLIGINSFVSIVEWAEYVEIREDETAYDIFVTGLIAVPIPTLKLFICKEYAGWTDDEKILTLINEFYSCTNRKEQQRIWEELHLRSYEYLPAINVGHYKDTSAWSEKLQGVYTDFGYYFWNATLSE